MADPDVPPGWVREHLGRILCSRRFRTSDSLCRLLRYTVETTLAGRGDELKEYTIGVEALGRTQSFDPREDSIVRVLARKLRERLAAYYAAEGRDENGRIVYHAGSYLPTFTATAQPSAAPRTVAVLTFMNLTAEDALGYFCDGLAEELIDLLARSRGLRVVARTSSFGLKGAGIDAREIGRQLGADWLIEGAVRGSEGHYRVTVRMLSTADGYQIWAEKYDCALHDVLAVESQVATSVACALRSEAPPPGAPVETEALMLYLQARYAWNKRTEQGFSDALELYAAAARRDPRAAKAWTGIAECHLQMAMHGLEPRALATGKARESAAKALRVAPAFPRALAVLAAATAIHDRQFIAAEDLFRQALALDPADSEAHHGYATVCLRPQKRFVEALQHMREAERLDPLSAPVANVVGFILYFHQQFSEAFEQCTRTIALHPAFYRTYALLARVYAAQGRFAESLEACAQARRLMNGGASFLPDVLGTLGFAHASAGDRSAASGVLDELHDLERRFANTAYERALVFTDLAIGRRPLRH